MRLSVVINTYNRCKSLRKTLQSLSNQSCNDFEVIVVNGPSTDETDVVVKGFDNVKVVKCLERNLSVSRNLGIDNSSGDIVAFIDDDAIAEFNWVRDILAGYTDESIGGVGGIVYDYTGVNLQYKYSSCNRFGDTDFYIEPPFDEYNVRGAKKFLYLQGTNCSFRRKCLELIGGFDEEFEYYLDEVDVCMRIIDIGYKIKPLDNAYVYHKYKESFMRNEERVVLHPYSIVKNKYYFAYKNNLDMNGKDIDIVLEPWLQDVLLGGENNYKCGKMSMDELEIYKREVIEGIQVGKMRGRGDNKTRKINEKQIIFSQYNKEIYDYKRLTICYISKEYPPNNFGGIGRYTYDLATTFASYGHNVHVVTSGEDCDSVDYEDGVWVHRIVPKLYDSLSSLQLGWNFSLLYSNYLEVKKIAQQSPIDVIEGPIWLCETGFINLLFPRPVIVTLMTTQKIIKNVMGMKDTEKYQYDKLIDLENYTLKKHNYIHPISNSICESCKVSFKDDALIKIIPLGCRDIAKKYVRKRANERIRILSVGRLEERKGTDLLLKVIPDILAEKNNVEFVFIGKDTRSTKKGISYKEKFLHKYKDERKILNNVLFLDEVSEEILMQNYSDADILCVPSRYESFGIVLLEGMSFNNAILAANIGGIREIVTNHDAGLVFEAENVNELKKCLLELIENKKTRLEYALKGRCLYEKEYTLQVVYKRLYEFYLQVMTEFEQHSVDIKFNTDEVCEMIASVERIPIAKAKKIVDSLLLDNKECSRYDERKIKKIYNKIRNKYPRLAVQMKYMLFPLYVKFFRK